MPRLWSETIEAHRREVREAILDSARALVGEHGVTAVTMSRVAERTGIGRGTLYRYFPDVEAILHAWHERQVARHLDELAGVRDGPGDPAARLEAVLRAWARIARARTRHDPDLGALLHRAHRDGHAGEQGGAHGGQPGAGHGDRARRELHAMVRQLLAGAAETGGVRTDVSPDELATYCLHALSAAADLPDGPAVDRLVGLTLAGLRRPDPDR